MISLVKQELITDLGCNKNQVFKLWKITTLDQNTHGQSARKLRRKNNAQADPHFPRSLSQGLTSIQTRL